MTTGPRAWLATTAFVMAAFLSACTGETPRPENTATSPPATPPSTSSSSVAPEEQVPRVQQPLDDATLVGAPCSSLTTPQLADLQLDVGYDEHAPGPEGGPSDCSYADLDPATELVVFLFYFDHEDGLGELYDMRHGSLWTDWTPIEIDGYPAVRFRDYKAANVCDLGFATSDTAYFRLQVADLDIDADRDTCGLVTAIGTAVLATIKAAN